VERHSVGDGKRRTVNVGRLRTFTGCGQAPGTIALVEHLASREFTQPPWVTAEGAPAPLPAPPPEQTTEEGVDSPFAVSQLLFAVPAGGVRGTIASGVQVRDGHVRDIA